MIIGLRVCCGREIREGHLVANKCLRYGTSVRDNPLIRECYFRSRSCVSRGERDVVGHNRFVSAWQDELEVRPICARISHIRNKRIVILGGCRCRRPLLLGPLNAARQRTQTGNGILGSPGRYIDSATSGRLHCRLQLIYRCESCRAQNSGDQIIEPLFLQKPYSAKCIAKLPIMLTCPVNHVQQAMTKTIKIGYIYDPGGVRQVLINGRGPFIKPASDIADGPARFNIVHCRAKYAGQHDASLLQLSGPSQKGRQNGHVCRVIRRVL